MTGLSQDADGVTVALADGEELRARYVVGCDGAHSAVRGLLGVEFAGKQYETHILLADVRLTTPPEDPMFARTNAEGAVIVVPFGDGWFRAIAWDRERERAPLSEPVTHAEMRNVGASVLALTDAFNQLVLGRSKLRNALQRLAIRAIVHFGRTRRAMTGRLTGIGVVAPERSDIVHMGHGDPALPPAVLVRPDAYVAWAGDRDISAALEHWCGTTERIVR